MATTPPAQDRHGRAPEIAALDGVRVLDLADESAVFATRILADLGADVILIEPPGGSPARRLAPHLSDEPGLPPIPADERSLVHQYHNAGKRSALLDIASPAGAERLRELAARADVLVETAPPGRMAELGLDYAALRERSPGLVYASVTPFGQRGAWRARRANDLVAAAAGGLLWVTGERDGPPVQGAARPSYALGSLAAATGVMLALAARDRDPERRGAHLDVSLQEATALGVLQTSNATLYEWFGRVPGRPGLSNALRCRDGGWVSFVTRPDRFDHFVKWVNEVGIPNELRPEDWPHARIGAPAEGNPVLPLVRELTRRLGREAFLEGAARAEQIALPICDFRYMEAHEHFRANRQFLDVAHESLGRQLGFVRSPVDAMAREIPLRRAPLLGEHTEKVMAELERRPPQGAASPSPRCAPASPLRALEGVRVVDLCWVLAGPIGTRILANFGAEVIRIESSRRPDGVRSHPGPDGQPGQDLAGLFNTANTGKLSVALDLGAEPGRQVLRRLIARADVVTSNFRPGALERMGLGYDDLVAVKADVILLTMPGTHSRGPWRSRSTFGNTVMSGSGFNPLMGFPGQPPRGLGVAFPDFTCPYLLATTVLAALRERGRTGRGQHLDLSQLSATIALLGVEWMQYRATGRQPPRAANRSPDHCPHGVYPTRGEDEWCAIAVETDAEWRRFCRAIGRPELARDRRFATLASRKAHEDELDGIVCAWTRERERWELCDRLQAGGVAAAPVEHLRDMLERDPQLRQHYQRVSQPCAPEVEIPVDAEAIRFAGFEHRLVRAPMFGEHSERVLREVAGLGEVEIARLARDGVIG